MKPQIIAVLGPSGVGKSTTISTLARQDDAFRYVPPYTTRVLRPGESEKIRVAVDKLFTLQRQGQLLALQKVFDNWYGTPLRPIIQASAAGVVPIIDWPANRLAALKHRFPGRVTSVYLVPPSVEVLQLRLQDGRDKDGNRFRVALAELTALERGDFQGLIDFYIGADGSPDVVAARVRAALVQTLRNSRHY